MIRENGKSGVALGEVPWGRPGRIDERQKHIIWG